MTALAFCILNKILSSSHLHSKILRFITTTNTTTNFYNFNKYPCLRVYFFVINNFICFAFMSTSNTPSLCHSKIEILFVIRRCTRLNINITFLSMFKKIKFNFCIYIHIILGKKILSLII